MVSDGTPYRLAATIDGAVCVDARRRKERTYPELLEPRSRAKLLVVAGHLSHWLSSAFSPGPRPVLYHALMCGTGLAVEVGVALGVLASSFRCFLAGIAQLSWC